MFANRKKNGLYWKTISFVTCDIRFSYKKGNLAAAAATKEKIR